jgi:hypothetical protein
MQAARNGLLRHRLPKMPLTIYTVMLFYFVTSLIFEYSD